MKMSRQQVVDELTALRDGFAEEYEAIPICLEEAIRILKNVRGRWIVRRGNYNEEFECSECQHISKDGGNYCGNCGARMVRNDA